MENSEVKRFIEERTDDARLEQLRDNLSCDNCMAIILADFDFSGAQVEVFDPVTQALIWTDCERHLLNVRGEWIAAYIAGEDFLIDLSRKYQYKLDSPALVRRFAEHMGAVEDILEWRIVI